MSKKPTTTEPTELQTIDLDTLGAVTGGTSSSSSSDMMMPMMMMMMMQRNHQPQQVIQAAAPQSTFNGQAMGYTLGADGSWNYNAEE